VTRRVRCDPAAVAALVRPDGDGAVATFVGLVRDHNAGRQVLWLDYEAFAHVALRRSSRSRGSRVSSGRSPELAIHHRPAASRHRRGERRHIAGRIRRTAPIPSPRLPLLPIERVKHNRSIWKPTSTSSGGDGLDRGGDRRSRRTRRGRGIAALERACT
jgi:molybdopterin synthase catalytic subunit